MPTQPPPKYKASFVGPPSIPMKQPNNNGVMANIQMGMPFKPNNMTQGSAWSTERRIYLNGIPQKPTGKILPAPCTYSSNPVNMPHHSARKSCDSKKVIDIEYFAKQTLLANHSSSDVTSRRKAIAIGKSSGMSEPKNELSFRTQDKNIVRSALSRCRSGGCVAPPKKGFHK